MIFTNNSNAHTSPIPRPNEVYPEEGMVMPMPDQGRKPAAWTITAIQWIGRTSPAPQAKNCLHHSVCVLCIEILVHKNHIDVK